MHLKHAMNRFVRKLILWGVVNTGLIMSQHFALIRVVWMREKNAALLSRSEMPKYEKEFEELVEVYSASMRNPYYASMVSAEFTRYLWNFQEAHEHGNRALEQALTLSQRLRALSFLVDRLLIPSVFTPEYLRTSALPSSTEKLAMQLRECGASYLELVESDQWRILFIESLERYSDVQFWESITLGVEVRLGSLEDFWQVAEQRPVVDEEEAVADSVLGDMTDSARNRLVAAPFRWAAGNCKLPSELRLRLAETSLRCSYAGLEWQLGSNITRDVSAAYSVASSILLSWAIARDVQDAPAPRILGGHLSPELGKDGQLLPWPELCWRQFQSIRDRSQGSFRQHIDELIERNLKPLYREFLHVDWRVGLGDSVQSGVEM